jgi:hypothetical protein
MIDFAICLPWYQDCPRVQAMVDTIASEFVRGSNRKLKRPGGSDIAGTRNILAHAALVSKAEAVLFIDWDNTPTVGNVARLLTHADTGQYDVISGNYWAADGKSASWRPHAPGHYTNGPDGGLVAARAVGMGCCLIMRAAFERAKPFAPLIGEHPHYFAQLALTETKEWLQEDYAFCHRVRSGGGSVVVDTCCMVGHLPREPEPIYPPNGEIYLHNDL